MRTRNLNRLIQHLDRMRILRARVDVALGCTYTQASDGHAFDQHQRIVFHHHTIREGAGVTFVSITNDVLLRRRCRAYRVPLDTGRESRATPSAQTGLSHLFNDLLLAHLQGFLQTSKAFMCTVVFNRQRVSDANARKGEALLALQEWNLFRQAERQRVRTAGGEASVKQRRHIILAHRAIAHATLRQSYFNQWLQPEHTARAVANQFNLDTATLRFSQNRLRSFIST